MSDKISVGKNIFMYPMPVVLVGTGAEDKANFMTVGWVSRVNASPPMVMVGINKAHYSAGLIMDNRAFSINFPSANMLEKVDYCGLVSGDKYDKSALFEVFRGETKAPMIRECPLCLECKLVQAIVLPTNLIFIGEIVESYTEERFMTEGKLDIKKMDPLMLTMPDNAYWKVGERAGKAWSDGKKLIKK